VNSVVVMTANVTGKWWTSPNEEAKCISPSLQNSFKETCTYKLGSICWGALLTPYIQTSSDILGTSVSGICSQNCVDKIQFIVAEYNMWGYVYVGLYGYEFTKASRKAVGMFRDRMWGPIIDDSLLKTLFFLVSLALGLVSAEFANILNTNTTFFKAAGESAGLISLGLGFGIGLILGAIMMAVLTGAIFTVIALFAEDQDLLEDNHPKFYTQMIKAYTRAYPDVLEK